MIPPIPPVGVGVYARDQSAAFLNQFAFVAINGNRSDAVSVAAAVTRQKWVYSTPEYWQPATWPAEIPKLVALARRIGAVGIIANPESGWTSAQAPLARAMATELRRQCSQAGLRLIVSSYPAWGMLGSMEPLRGFATGNPQLYGRTTGTQSASAIARFWARWTDVFGPNLVAAVPGWPSSDFVDTEAELRAFLATIPRSPGAIVWLPAGTVAPMFVRVYRSWSPSGFGGPGNIALAALSAVTSASFAIPALIGLAVLVIFFLMR